MSAFKTKGKTTGYKTWLSFDEATEAFKFVVDNPFYSLQPEDQVFKILERFAIRLYLPRSELECINLCREYMFRYVTKDLDKLPTTKNALLQHLKRAIYQCSIWSTSTIAYRQIPPATDFGWVFHGEKWAPLWTTIAELPKASNAFIKCGCRKPCTQCKCKKSKIECSLL